MDKNQYKFILYLGKKIYISPGMDLTKQQIKERLDKMEIIYNKDDKEYLSLLYDKAIEKDENKNKILDILLQNQKKLLFIENIKERKIKQENIEKLNIMENKNSQTIKEPIISPKNNINNSTDSEQKNNIYLGDPHRVSAFNQENIYKTEINYNTPTFGNYNESNKDVRINPFELDKNDNIINNKFIMNGIHSQEKIKNHNEINRNNLIKQINDSMLIPINKILSNDSNNSNIIYINTNYSDTNRRNVHTNSDMEEESDGEEEIISYDDESKDCCEKTSSVLDVIFSIIFILIFILIFLIKNFQIYNPNSNYFENTLAEIGIKMFCIFWLINLYEYFEKLWPYALVFLAISTIYNYYKRCKFKSLCRKIFEDIKKELKKRESRSMSENEIIVKYSTKYKIKRNSFVNEFLKELYKLKKKDNSSKIKYSENGVTIWKLRH